MDWKEEFIRLFSLEDVGAHRKALELKKEHIPEKLYRYRPLTDVNMAYRFGEIVRGELFLSHPKELNDPFEASSLLENSEPAEYMTEKDDFTESFREIMDPRDFKRIFESDTWYNDLLAYVAEKSVPTEKVEETKTAISKAIMAQFETINSEASDLFRKCVRFACFSTDPDNLPMWHHYTNGHTGICLEYATEDIINVYQINMLFPVFYVERMPDVTNMLLQKGCPQFNLMEYLTMHKLKDWSYESEWRLIYNVGSWYSSPEDVPVDFWTQGKMVQFVRPRKIIMGIKISPAHEKMIREYAKIAGIHVIKAKQTEYGLRIK